MDNFNRKLFLKEQRKELTYSIESLDDLVNRGVLDRGDVNSLFPDDMWEGSVLNWEYNDDGNKANYCSLCGKTFNAFYDFDVQQWFLSQMIFKNIVALETFIINSFTEKQLLEEQNQINSALKLKNKHCENVKEEENVD
jgi:hypothetical protein